MTVTGPTKIKGGRSPLAAGCGQSPTLNVRVTAAQKQRLTELAASQGVKVSELARRAIADLLATLA